MVFHRKIDVLDTIEKIVKDTGKSHILPDGKPGQKWYLNFMKSYPLLGCYQRNMGWVENWLVVDPTVEKRVKYGRVQAANGREQVNLLFF